MSKKPITRQEKSFPHLLMLAAALTFFAAASGVRAQADRGGMPGDFDYYVLSLSWSPTYCSGKGGESDSGGSRNSDRYDGEYGDEEGYGGNGRYSSHRYGGYNRGDEQCSGIRPYAFVLHGLWPQYERKGWPEACRTGSRPWVPGETIDRMMDIMPSRRLVIHEYSTHGVCSGLDAEQYFEAARKAYRSLHIPDAFRDLSEPLKVTPEEVRKAFLDANRELGPDMIQITCSRDLLREVHVCFTKDLAPRPCSGSERDRCSYGTVIMPPVRGGGTGPHGGPSLGRDNQ